MNNKMKKIITGFAFISTLCYGSAAFAASYTVNAGDNLWQIAQKHHTSVDTLKAINNLTNDNLQIGQVLQITGSPANTTNPINQTNQVSVAAATGPINPVTIEIADAPNPSVNPSAPAPASPSEPSPAQTAATTTTTYLVQPGDSPYKIAQKFNVGLNNLLNTNQLTDTDTIYPGQKITIPAAGTAGGAATLASAPATTPVANSNTAGSGQLVDWFKEGQGLLKSGTLLTVVDIGTQKQFQMKVLSAGNHADVEPLTKQDTATMLQIFGKWQWQPRPVMLSVAGRKIAGSLSGQPHDVSTIKDNGAGGHFDLYLHNSEPHGSGISRSYVQQHRDAVIQAANAK